MIVKTFRTYVSLGNLGLSLGLHHKIEKRKEKLKTKLKGDGLQVWGFLEIMEEMSFWFRLLEFGFASVYLNLLNPFFLRQFFPCDDPKKCLANGLKDFEPQNLF